MAFTKMGDFTFNHVEQPDKLNLPAAETKAKLDSRANELKTAFNAAVDLLNATAAGDSGADNVGAAAIDGIEGASVQAQMVGMKGYVDAHKADTTTAHGAVSTATANRLALRNANGQLLAVNNPHNTNGVLAIKEAKFETNLANGATLVSNLTLNNVYHGLLYLTAQTSGDNGDAGIYHIQRFISTVKIDTILSIPNIAITLDGTYHIVVTNNTGSTITAVYLTFTEI